MHGRPRYPQRHASDDAKDREKADRLKGLLAAVIKNHQERCYTKDALTQSAQLVEINPEVYTAWNYRKLAFRHRLDAEPDEAGRKRLAEDELRLIERALRANVKSYGAWYHRKWIMEFGLTSLDHEFLLLQKLLKEDPRNFHGWDYRRFAARAKQVTAEKELEYATDKINENFSNYSAWHYRSTLLSQLFKEGRSKEKILTDEYELVNQAYFTEPEDQSAWVYNSWLLGETKISSGIQLVGAWPSEGSTVVARVDKQTLSVCLSSRNPLDKDYRYHSKGLPVTLRFSEDVTDVILRARSNPEIASVTDVRLDTLSCVKGPSKTWVAEFPLWDCAETEIAIFLTVSVPGVGVRDWEIHFNLEVSFGCVSTEEDESSAAGVDAFFWPGQRSDDGCTEQSCPKRNIDGNDEPGPTGNSLLQSIKESPCTSGNGNVDWRQQLLEDQIGNLRELLELEENSKWATLTLARVLLALSDLTNNPTLYSDEVLSLVKKLINLDPMHGEYYQALQSSIFIAQVLHQKGAKQLWRNGTNADKELSRQAGWLCWNALSLTRFDSIEQMLWVQKLDLSHNKLRSLQGLEAMQLLVALDVSHNRISHLTALAPLQLNRRLQFLNISYNEIGSRQVDSSRYSFPSALTNQVKQSDSVNGDDPHDNVISDSPWEMQAIFRDLQLKCLEIKGNLVACDKSFRDYLLRAIPSLKLLDGENVH